MKTRRPHPPARGPRGFTLVELMIASALLVVLTGTVLALARQSMAVFAAESQLGNASEAASLSFERMKADISRAGYLVTPNHIRDQKTCNAPGMADELRRRIAAVRIDDLGVTPPAPNLAPTLTIAGAFDSAEEFPAHSIVTDSGTQSKITLQHSGAVAREVAHDRTMADIFQPGRLLRIVSNTDGMEQYAFIVDTSGTMATLTDALTIKVTGVTDGGLVYAEGSNGCGIKGNGTGYRVNPVNLIQYRVLDLATATELSATPYQELRQALLAGNALTPGTKVLVRSEATVDSAGAVKPVPTTLELLAEYVDDLSFGAIVAEDVVPSGPSTMKFVRISPDAPTTLTPYVVPSSSSTVVAPQFLRSLTPRLRLRSRSADRVSNTPAQGRIALPDKRFVRTHTLQSDIVLNNLAGIAWQ